MSVRACVFIREGGIDIRHKELFGILYGIFSLRRATWPACALAASHPPARPPAFPVQWERANPELFHANPTYERDSSYSRSRPLSLTESKERGKRERERKKNIKAEQTKRFFFFPFFPPFPS